jgi:hypothetical protein
MGRGCKRSSALVLVTVTVLWQLAGCGGRAAAPSGSGDSASLSGDAGAVASGGFDTGTAAAGNVGGESQTAPDIDGGPAQNTCPNDDEEARVALAGQPCPAAGEVCGPGGCTNNCYCVLGDAGALAWQCWAPPCK